MDTKFVITKLNNQNYQLWKFKLEMLLTKDELWDVVNDDIPNEPNAEWKRKNRQAKVMISLMVEDDQLIHIRNAETGKEMWTLLKNLHERKNLNSKLYLLRKLYKKRLGENEDMRTHINHILEIVEQLRGIEENMKEDHIAALILCSLPESYASLITAMEARPESELTLGLVKMKLIDEFERRKEFDGESSDARGSVFKSTEMYDGSRRETRLCFFCNKPGHLRQDCRARKARFTKQSFRAKNVTGSETNDYVQQNKSESEDESYVCFNIGIEKNKGKWYIDSGATAHMTSDERFFDRIEKSTSINNVFLADGRKIAVKGIGAGHLKGMNEDQQEQAIALKEVLYVPDLEGGLISVKRLTKLGYKIVFEGAKCKIIGNNKTAIATLDNQLYKLEQACNIVTIQPRKHINCIHDWHKKLGHRDIRAIHRLKDEKLVTGLNLSNCEITTQCINCIKGKLSRKPFPKRSLNHSMRPYELIHSDVCGPMKTTSKGGKKYFVTFIDDFSGFTETFLIKSKDEVGQKLQEYVNKWNNKFERKPLFLRTDGGGEYINHEIDSYLKAEGIQRQVTVPYSPEQNGVAERKNRSLTEMTRCMLLEAELDNSFWGEALITATYLQNRLPHRESTATPYELWMGTKPDLGHLMIFGQEVCAHVPRESRSKLDDRAVEALFMGYSDRSKGYRILIQNTGKIVISRDVIPKLSEFNNETDTIQKNIVDLIPDEVKTEIVLKEETVVEDKHETVIPRRSSRSNIGKPAPRLAYNVNIEMPEEPQCWSDILKLSPDKKEKWIKATKDEINSFERNGTWDLVKRPLEKKIIGSKWIFKTKQDKDGSIIQHKARLVAKGFTQITGIDYEESYAPVARYTTIRVLLAIAGIRNMVTRHLDVRSAFLNGELKEETYMEQPEGHVLPGQEDMVYKLKKGVYGLKQSANLWNKRINNTLASEGYIRSSADPCLYSKIEKGASTHILIYVDDLMICSDTEEDMRKIKQSLECTYEMTDLGELNMYLGIEIKKGINGGYSIQQTSKIHSLLHQHGMLEAKETKTPMETGYLNQTEGNEKDVEPEIYRQLVGALLHIATVTRPDIATAVGILGRKVSNPKERDWIAAKRVLRYLKGTVNMELQLGTNMNIELNGYADADWAGDQVDRKSTTGFLFLIGDSLVTWTSRKQPCVAHSSTEAEYVSLASACQEVVWLRSLLSDLGYEQNNPTPIHEDNQGSIKLSSSEKFHKRTKHIDVKFHIAKDLQDKGIIKLLYTPTEHMIADFLTKPLPQCRLEAVRELLGIKIGIC